MNETNYMPCQNQFTGSKIKRCVKNSHAFLHSRDKNPSLSEVGISNYVTYRFDVRIIKLVAPVLSRLITQESFLQHLAWIAP